MLPDQIIGEGHQGLVLVEEGRGQFAEDGNQLFVELFDHDRVDAVTFQGLIGVDMRRRPA